METSNPYEPQATTYDWLRTQECLSCGMQTIGFHDIEYRVMGEGVGTARCVTKVLELPTVVIETVQPAAVCTDPEKTEAVFDDTPHIGFT